MSPDTIPSQFPITLMLQRDTVWVLGVVVVAGCWTVTVGLVWWLSDVVRAVRARWLGVRKW